MAMDPCSACGKTLTSRVDKLCDGCHKARELIEMSQGQAVLTKIILDCENDWRLMDRIDDELRRRKDDLDKEPA